jgi:group I intron endonuclease
MLKILSLFNTIYNDAPQPWQIGFQDSAAPGFTGIVELHNTIFFYLIVICVGVLWVLGSSIYYFNTKKSPIIHKYLNHGKYVPVQKCSKFHKKILSNNIFIPIRTYITISKNQIKYDDINSVKVYENILDMKKDILNENGGKSGIYMLTNKITKEIYIGQSINLSNRFKNYLNLSYIKSKDSFRISKALIKYGYSNFSLTILEYCNKSDLQAREQYYFDKLNPQYNILKIAGSSLNSKPTEKTKRKFSQTLKGVYVGENSALFDKHHTKETKTLLSLKKVKENNPLFEKTHSENSIELMRQKVLSRKHFEDTKLKLNVVSGNPVNIHEKFSSKGFKLIGSFVSVRRAGKFLGISGSTVIKYMNSGEIFKNRYKFSSK